MTFESRRRFLKNGLGLAAVAASGPAQLLAWLTPTTLTANGNGQFTATYTIKISELPPLFEHDGVKYGLTEVGGSIKLTEFDELEMNPDHCKHAGVDGNEYPITIVRVKESGEDAFTAVSSWCPHNDGSQLSYFKYQEGESGLFVCEEHEFSSFMADGTWVAPEDSPYKDAPQADDFFFNKGPDGKPYLTRFDTSFDGVDTITISGILVGCVADADEEEVARSFELHQNLPNPFRGKTLIPLTLERSSSIRLTLLSLSGETIAEIADTHLDAGDHMIPFDSLDISAGTYYYRLDVDGESLVRRMIIVR